MPRLETIRQDDRIMRLLDKCVSPRAIAAMLNLRSQWVVYNAVRRRKAKTDKNGQNVKRRS